MLPITLFLHNFSHFSYILSVRLSRSLFRVQTVLQRDTQREENIVEYITFVVIFCILCPHFCALLICVFIYLNSAAFRSSSMQIYGFNYCQCIFFYQRRFPLIQQIEDLATRERDMLSHICFLSVISAVSSQILLSAPHRRRGRRSH